MKNLNSIRLGRRKKEKERAAQTLKWLVELAPALAVMSPASSSSSTRVCGQLKAGSAPRLTHPEC